MISNDLTSPTPGPISVVAVPEIRDYGRINAQVALLLDSGQSRIRLAGAEGQRLLLSGLNGPWRAVVEIEGRAGPELAASLDAPGLMVLCHGPAADGAGRGLRAGGLLITGDVGVAAGYAMTGGTLIVQGRAGPRAGLVMAGGVLVVGGNADRLMGERQCGGLIFALGPQNGPHAGHGRRGGRLIALENLGKLDPAAAKTLHEALEGFTPWLEPTFAQLINRLTQIDI
ncbi:MAG: glutamate synthase [Isosphaeraceae bacterium]